MVVSASERSERAEIVIIFCVENIRYFQYFVSKSHICQYYCPCVLNTDIALFMTSYTNQKTRNLRTYLNDCERVERASRKFSPFPVLSLLVNSNSPRAPGYASGAHATEIIF